MKLVDTNIFLEILLQQKKSEIAKGILRELIETNEPFIITSFTIHSIIVILEKRRMINELQIFMSSLSEMENLLFYYPTFEEEREIITNMTRWNLDFDDSFQYFVAQKMDAEIITFDHDFQKISDVTVQIL
ncbi:MAG TPA: PIN domain-containing protein [bacterium]